MTRDAEVRDKTQPDDPGAAWAEFMALLEEGSKRGLRVRFWVCPLHHGPAGPMITVLWDGDEATCALCGFTRSEHRRRRESAIAASDPTGLQP